MVIISPEINNDSKAPIKVLSRKERILALRSKLKPISREDAEMIDRFILEAREASIYNDISS